MKRLVSFILAGMMIGTATISLASSKAEIKESKPFISGYLDKTFAPEKSITRAEAVKMAVDALGIEKTKEGIDKFSDMASGEHWASGYVGAAIKEGIVSGNPDGKFYPDENITRAELITIVSKSIKDGNANKSKVRGFSDIDEAHWAFSFIIRAAKFGYVSGYIDGTLKPDQDITRAEVTKMLNVRMGRDSKKIDTSKLSNKFKDMNNKEWSYKDVLLGSSEFKYKVENGKFIIVSAD